MKKILSKKKKIIIASISVFLILATAGGACFLLIPVKIRIDMNSIIPIKNNVVLFDKGEYGKFKALGKVDNQGNLTDEAFKIVSFTDTHFDTYTKNTEITMEMMIANINREKPDLVIFVGDNITSSTNRQRAIQFAEVMEKFGVYWAPVLGNHEGDNRRSITREEFAEIFSSYPHCLMPSGKKTLADGQEVYGYGNYIVNILNSEGDIRKSLIFLDGGDRVSKEDAKTYNIDTESYDFIKQSQIDWYKESLTKINAGRASKVESILYCHIPLGEYATAYEEATLEGGNTSGIQLIYGKMLEDVACSEYNSGMFNAILELESTKTVFAGHDHINDFRVLYKGVLLCYNQKSGYSSYDILTKKIGDKLLQGCTIVNIEDNGAIAISQNINADLYDQTKVLKLY